MTKILMTVAAMAAVAFSVPALAESDSELLQIKIRYDKSDLNSVDGRRGIDRKINFAVNSLCGDQVLGNKEEIEVLRDCKKAARSMARAQLPIAVADSRP